MNDDWLLGLSPPNYHQDGIQNYFFAKVYFIDQSIFLRENKSNMTAQIPPATARFFLRQPPLLPSFMHFFKSSSDFLQQFRPSHEAGTA